MPKKKPASKKAKNLVKYGAVALLVLISISLALYLPPTLKQRHLEYKFMLLDTDVDSLKAELEAKFPDKTFEKDKYCANYPGELFKGPLHCDISTNVSRASFTFEETQTVESIIKNKNAWEQKSSAQIKKHPYSPGVYTNKTTGIECRLSFQGKGNMYNLDFYCSVPSKRSFYPYRG